MRAGHFIEKCRHCGAVTAQCRCMDCNRQAHFTTCKDCEGKDKEPVQDRECPFCEGKGSIAAPEPVVGLRTCHQCNGSGKLPEIDIAAVVEMLQAQTSSPAEVEGGLFPRSTSAARVIFDGRRIGPGPVKDMLGNTALHASDGDRLVVVDFWPEANWGHSCLYILLSQDGTPSSYVRHTWPPEDNEKEWEGV